VVTGANVGLELVQADGVGKGLECLDAWVVCHERARETWGPERAGRRGLRQRNSVGDDAVDLFSVGLSTRDYLDGRYLEVGVGLRRDKALPRAEVEHWFPSSSSRARMTGPARREQTGEERKGDYWRQRLAWRAENSL
jgi:hypothetical protein